LKLADLESYKYEAPNKVSAPTPYFDHWISQYHHPTSIANDLLREVKHFEFSAMSFTGAMGAGKTSFATCLAHHIHQKDDRFNIIWAGDDEFSHIKRFVAEIPKNPCVIIFDDVTSSLKEIGSTAMAANFKELTKIRHTFNEGGMGGVPVICLIIFHYSLDLEKRYRNIVRNNAYLGFSNTERSNIDVIAPKDSQARMEILKFARIYHDMNSPTESFSLKTGNKKQFFKLDEPFRPCCVVRETEAHVILFSKDDKCNVCSQKKTTQFLPSNEIFEKIKTAYGRAGVQALKLQLWKRGYYKAITSRAASASEYIENNIFSKYSTDMDSLVLEIYKESHQKPPLRMYHKRKIEEQLNNEFHEVSIKKEEPNGDETFLSTL